LQDVLLPWSEHVNICPTVTARASDNLGGRRCAPDPCGLLTPSGQKGRLHP
jgi:hypothetical protein